MRGLEDPRGQTKKIAKIARDRGAKKNLMFLKWAVQVSEHAAMQKEKFKKSTTKKKEAATFTQNSKQKTKTHQH